MRYPVPAFLLAWLAVSPVFAETIEFEGRYWLPDLDSQVTYKGTEVDVKSDLGVGDENFPEGKITWFTGPDSRLSLDYTQADFDGDSILTRTFQFNQQTYTVGARVISAFNLSYAAFDWIWEFMKCPGDTFKAGTLVGARAASVELDVDSPGPAISESKDFVGGLPVLGAAFDFVPIKELAVFGQAAGMTGGSYGHFVDAEAGVKLIPVTYVSLALGYRFVDARFKDDPDRISVRLNGPFASASVRF